MKILIAEIQLDAARYAAASLEMRHYALPTSKEGIAEFHVRNKNGSELSLDDAYMFGRHLEVGVMEEKYKNFGLELPTPDTYAKNDVVYLVEPINDLP